MTWPEGQRGKEPLDQRGVGESRQRHVTVLLTTHNRASKTAACLKSLRSAAKPAAACVQVVVVDAASTDGTADAVRQVWPGANVVAAPSDVYWGTGMRIASRHAGNDGPWKLWLNDDVLLHEHALSALLDAAEDYAATTGDLPVVVGATNDSRGETSYSGLMRQGRGLNFKRVSPPSERPQRVDTFNGNIVLWPTQVLDQLGDVDRRFPHAMGDIDLGLRASAKHPVLLVPGHLGVCERNPAPTPEPTFRGRLRRVASPKQQPPGAWVTFALRHGGLLGPLRAVKPYMSAIRPPRG